MRRSPMKALGPNFHTHEHGAIASPSEIVLLPAMTVLPFIRTPLGYDMVHPRNTIVRTVGFAVLPVVFWFLYMALGNTPPANMGHLWLVYFAVLSCVVSSVIFARRAIGQRRGEKIHTAEAGYSWLTWRTQWPIPLTEQVIIPFALAATGWLIAQSFSFELGWWLVVCGASYLLMARWEYRRTLSQTRATVDDLIRAQTFEERFTGHERQRRNAGSDSQRTGERGPSAGPMGFEPDMAELGKSGPQFNNG